MFENKCYLLGPFQQTLPIDAGTFFLQLINP
jgi:hypothetical protein